ncbi:MAG: FxSxx-COOH system tetratricopeptide repeat protein, partial [Streptosporangiaceae bacterium]
MRTGQVFISHTSDMARFPEDRPFVQAALDAVGRAGMAPVDMRHFAARDGSPADYCQQRVHECEIYVAVIGFQYGSLVPGEEVSFTELEFQAASVVGVPRLVFLLEDAACPSQLNDTDRGPVERFRQRLRDAGLVVRSFTSGAGLELEVFHALSELTVQDPGRQAPTSLRAPPSVPQVSAMVPQIWNVPNRNADFTGRGIILDRLHDELTGDGTAVVLARAVYGLGGVGKTQVALEYAHRFKTDYRLIWWVNAEQPLEITLALAELAGRLGLQISDNAADTAASALEQLRRDVAGRWLLIFDNAEDPADLAPFLPTGSGHILITSRNQAWTRHAEPVELDVFSRQESLAHLRHHVPGLDSGDAARVSAAVADLPLAIEQAAAWLAETGMPAALYAEWLETQTTSALGLNKPLDYAKPVVAAWNLSIDRLKQQSPASVRLLQILAFCSPDPISATLLYGEAMLECLLPYDETLSQKLMIGRVIREVSRFALVKVDQSTNSVQIHRLVQAVIRSQMTEEEQIGARHEVHKILTGARPRQGETDDPANWSTYDIIWPHLGPSVAEECDD